MTNLTDEMMDSAEHPQDHQILNFIKAPDSTDFGDLRLHLAGCRYCRRRTELTTLLRDQGHWLENEPVEVDFRMADLIAGKLDAEQAGELKQELKADPAQLRAALHYASHASAMGEANETKAIKTSIWTLTKAMLQTWFGFQAPVWKTVPVVAVLMVVATVLVNQYYPIGVSGQERIVAFEDNRSIQFAEHETRPGIGFFTQPGVNAMPFGGMKIDLEKNRLRFSWPPVDGAQAYTLKLQVFRDGETRVLARAKLAATSVDLEIAEPLTQHRYEWVLSGDTSDNRSFQASGGFVITTD